MSRLCHGGQWQATFVNAVTGNDQGTYGMASAEPRRGSRANVSGVCPTPQRFPAAAQSSCGFREAAPQKEEAALQDAGRPVAVTARLGI